MVSAARAITTVEISVNKRFMNLGRLTKRVLNNNLINQFEAEWKNESRFYPGVVRRAFIAHKSCIIAKSPFTLIYIWRLLKMVTIIKTG